MYFSLNFTFLFFIFIFLNVKLLIQLSKYILYITQQSVINVSYIFNVSYFYYVLALNNANPYYGASLSCYYITVPDAFVTLAIALKGVFGIGVG